MENENEHYGLDQGENKDDQESSVLIELLGGIVFVALAMFGYYLGSLFR